jgi:hypothetical protein
MAALGDQRERQPGRAARTPDVRHGQRLMRKVCANVVRTRRHEKLHLCHGERFDLDFHRRWGESPDEVAPRGEDVGNRSRRISGGEPGKRVGK